MRRVITHCWTMENMLLTTQYSTRPEGKKKNITEKISGIHSIIFACSGSGGVGLSLVCTNIVAAITTGRMYQGSGVERSWIQPIHGALRISTAASNTQYSAMNT